MDNKDHITKHYMFVTLLNIIITVIEFLGGIFSASLALLSDAIHNLSDVGTVILSFIAYLISKHRRNQNKTFGYQRAETLAAFTNGIILLMISLILFIKAFERLGQPENIKGGLMLFIAIIGLLTNLVSMFIMYQGAKKSLNIRSTFIHMMTDALSSLAVVFGSVCIYFWHITWLDSILTIFVSIFVFYEAYKIIIKSANILMESNPNIDLKKVNKIVLQFPEIKNIHHVHVWRYSDDYIMLDAHLNVDKDLTASQFEQVTIEIGQKLQQELDINHINLQAECNRDRNDGMIVEHGKKN